MTQKIELLVSGEEYIVTNPGTYTIYPDLNGGTASIEVKQEGMDRFHPIENGTFDSDNAATIYFSSQTLVKPTLTGEAKITIVA